jgi:CO/xanthine dehydrogenase FAD-binding subunit
VTASLVVAASVDDALRELSAGARAVAGGTDLVVGARQGKASLPERLVAIHHLAELRSVEEADGVLRIGALATHAELAAHPTVRARLTALADAAAIVGSPATRATGTIGGNLMNASPAMETGGPLLCFDAFVVLRSVSGTRTVGVGDLLAGPGKTTAAPDELLELVDVTLPSESTGSCYLRLEYRRQMEIAVVGATAVLGLDGGRARTDPSPRPGSRVRTPRQRRRRPRSGARGATGRGGGGTDLRPAGVGPLPARDGRRDHPACDRDRRRARPRR